MAAPRVGSFVVATEFAYEAGVHSKNVRTIGRLIKQPGGLVKVQAKEGKGEDTQLLVHGNNTKAWWIPWTLPTSIHYGSTVESISTAEARKYMEFVEGKRPSTIPIAKGERGSALGRQIPLKVFLEEEPFISRGSTIRLAMDAARTRRKKPRSRGIVTMRAMAGKPKTPKGWTFVEEWTSAPGAPGSPGGGKTRFFIFKKGRGKKAVYIEGAGGASQSDMAWRLVIPYGKGSYGRNKTPSTTFDIVASQSKEVVYPRAAIFSTAKKSSRSKKSSRAVKAQAKEDAMFPLVEPPEDAVLVRIKSHNARNGAERELGRGIQGYYHSLDATYVYALRPGELEQIQEGHSRWIRSITKARLVAPRDEYRKTGGIFSKNPTRSKNPTDPQWAEHTDMGDTIDHGSLRLYVDATGVYSPELESIRLIDDDCDDDDPDEPDCEFIAYRAQLTRLKMREGHLLTARIADEWEPSWLSPLKNYTEVLPETLEAVASYTGAETDELIAGLTSYDPLERALAYERLISYHGWINFDQYPTRLTREEAEERIAVQEAWSGVEGAEGTQLWVEPEKNPVLPPPPEPSVVEVYAHLFYLEEMEDDEDDEEDLEGQVEVFVGGREAQHSIGVWDYSGERGIEAYDTYDNSEIPGGDDTIERLGEAIADGGTVEGWWYSVRVSTGPKVFRRPVTLTETWKSPTGLIFPPATLFLPEGEELWKWLLPNGDTGEGYFMGATPGEVEPGKNPEKNPVSPRPFTPSSGWWWVDPETKGWENLRGKFGDFDSPHKEMVLSPENGGWKVTLSKEERLPPMGQPFHGPPPYWSEIREPIYFTDTGTYGTQPGGKAAALKYMQETSENWRVFYSTDPYGSGGDLDEDADIPNMVLNQKVEVDWADEWGAMDVAGGRVEVIRTQSGWTVVGERDFGPWGNKAPKKLGPYTYVNGDDANTALRMFTHTGNLPRPASTTPSPPARNVPAGYPGGKDAPTPTIAPTTVSPHRAISSTASKTPLPPNLQDLF